MPAGQCETPPYCCGSHDQCMLRGKMYSITPWDLENNITITISGLLHGLPTCVLKLRAIRVAPADGITRSSLAPPSSTALKGSPAATGAHATLTTYWQYLSQVFLCDLAAASGYQSTPNLLPTVQGDDAIAKRLLAWGSLAGMCSPVVAYRMSLSITEASCRCSCLRAS
jgi:hypothetical protein